MRRLGAMALLAGSVVLPGCVTAFDNNRVELRKLHEQGSYQQAAAVLDTPQTKDLYTGNNQLLYWLDRGAVGLALDQTGTTLELLEKAEQYMEVKREPSTGDEFARWLLNDTVTPYYGEPYEDIYANVLKLLARLERNEISGGATVEARRMIGKADVLRDRYVRTKDVALKQDGVTSAAVASASRYTDVNSEGQFIESTLGDYLSAIAFMKDGDSNNQGVAGRRLLTALDLQSTLTRGVDASRFNGLADLDASAVNVLVVGLSGRGPHKVANRIGPIPLYEYPLYLELPELVGGSSEVGAVRLIATPTNGGPARTILLDKVEDMRAVAMENHKRQLPLIYTRTIIRSQAKAAAALVGTEVVKASSGRGSSRDLAQIGMIIAGLAFVTLTEKADLRCWTFLPGRADVAAIKLEPGEYSMTLVYDAPVGGTLYTSPPRTITVGGDARSSLTTIVEHYWR